MLRIGVAALLVGGCAAELPPATQPAQEVPHVPMPTDVPTKNGIVIVDTPEGPSTLSEVTGHGYGTDSEGNSITIDTERDLCTTPCAVDLAKGADVLVLRSLDRRDYGSMHVLIGNEPVVVRHMYEQTRQNTAAWITGITLAAIGGGFAFSGLITYAAARGANHTPTVPGEDSNPTSTTQAVG